MKDQILNQFGEKLQKLRLSQNLSQEKLAEIIEVDRTYISLLERGKRNPSLVCLNSIAKALNVTPNELIFIPEWQEDLKNFCDKYNIDLENLADVLNDPKVIPMIRGKAFEFTVQSLISQILSQKKYQVTNPKINAQTGLDDIDVAILDKEHKKTYSVECKLAAKGEFQLENNIPKIKVKCMRSRTLGETAAQQKAKRNNLNFELLMIHNDQYMPQDFDLVVTSIANAFYETDDQGLFYWNPPEKAMDFLTKINATNQEDAFYKIYVARSDQLSVNGINKTGNKLIKCSRTKERKTGKKDEQGKDIKHKTCPEILHNLGLKSCGFIPNYPIIYFDPQTGEPFTPWVKLEDIENLLY
ncbi:helix-turn-helix transcriptional regulator [Cyanobacterium aponinum UTEX 3222]|uniref:helix-turn-helix domain-containing protein n=1 Tax=Cyanobacterium aponinum TaxID=379064 RepID=UPI003093133B|nr:helix-turn-helix transcriptional regulator [Cyanobacterium aponinum UTEX 3222]